MAVFLSSRPAHISASNRLHLLIDAQEPASNADVRTDGHDLGGHEADMSGYSAPHDHPVAEQLLGRPGAFRGEEARSSSGKALTSVRNPCVAGLAYLRTWP